MCPEEVLRTCTEMAQTCTEVVYRICTEEVQTCTAEVWKCTEADRWRCTETEPLTAIAECRTLAVEAVGTRGEEAEIHAGAGARTWTGKAPTRVLTIKCNRA